MFSNFYLFRDREGPADDMIDNSRFPDLQLNIPSFNQTHNPFEKGEIVGGKRDSYLNTVTCRDIHFDCLTAGDLFFLGTAPEKNSKREFPHSRPERIRVFYPENDIEING